MGRMVPAVRRHVWLVAAFLIPFLGFIAVMMSRGFIPFGENGMVYCDGYHQYYPFLIDFRQKLLSGESLLYDWSLGLGQDYIGLYAYYLASPLNWLCVFVPEDAMLGFYAMLVPVKLGVAGFSFAYFLKNSFQKNDASIAVFSGFYALCAWALAYQWNGMWLDTFAILPLVIAGEMNLLKDRKYGLYVWTLFLSIVMNYYISLFTCLFVFLLFWCYEICRWQGRKRFVSDLGHIAGFSILVGGMTMFLMLPALAALRNAGYGSEAFPTGLQLNIASENTMFGIFDAFRQVMGNMAGGLEMTFGLEGSLPNIYSGIGTLFLAVLLLGAKKVSIRERLCGTGLLFFFMACIVFRQLDFLIHGMHFPCDIPYRFSFLFSFVLITMAYRMYLIRHELMVRQIFITVGIVSVILLMNDQRTDGIFLFYNFGFLFLYAGLCVLVSKVRSTVQGMAIENRVMSFLAASLVGVMCLETAANLWNFDYWYSGYGEVDFPKQAEAVDALMDTASEEDDSFWRMEMVHMQTKNDDALNGYNGISVFSSSVNADTSDFVKALGFSVNDAKTSYFSEMGSPVANLFLDLKYMIDRDGFVIDNSYLTEAGRCGTVSLMKNEAYLPFGFLVNENLGQLDFSNWSEDPFEFQNRMLTAASGVNGPFFVRVDPALYRVTGSDGVRVDDVLKQGHACDYWTDAEDDRVTFSFESDQTGLVCGYLYFSDPCMFEVYKNGTFLFSTDYVFPCMMSLCETVPGDVVEIRKQCDSDGFISVRPAVLNKENFMTAYAVLSQSTFEMTDFEMEQVTGHIDCDRDGLIYFSLTQDGNWCVTVDGIETEPVLIGNCMISVPVQKGSHEIMLVRKNSSLIVGVFISLISMSVWIVISTVSLRQKEGRKYVRKEAASVLLSGDGQEQSSGTGHSPVSGTQDGPNRQSGDG